MDQNDSLAMLEARIQQLKQALLDRQNLLNPSANQDIHDELDHLIGRHLKLQMGQAQEPNSEK